MFKIRTLKRRARVLPPIEEHNGVPKKGLKIKNKTLKMQTSKTSLKQGLNIKKKVIEEEKVEIGKKLNKADGQKSQSHDSTADMSMNSTIVNNEKSTLYKPEQTLIDMDLILCEDEVDLIMMNVIKK